MTAPHFASAIIYCAVVRTMLGEKGSRCCLYVCSLGAHRCHSHKQRQLIHRIMGHVITQCLRSHNEGSLPPTGLCQLLLVTITVMVLNTALVLGNFPYIFFPDLVDFCATNNHR